LPPFLNIKDIYFPSDLFDLRTDEVFVDCGAYNGDTLQSFMEHGGNGEMIAIEPDRANLEELMEKFHDAVPFECAVGSKKDVVSFDSGKGWLSSIGKGNSVVTVNTLDDLLADKRLTFIKMDIEGYELEALHGAERVIRNNRPILAICLYHRESDLWKIPEYVKHLYPDYRLYLRRYAEDCWEEVLYAVPTERIKR
jgi:FkbM family methyltransferase